MLTILLTLAASQAINLRDEGVPLGWARTLDCTGSGLTCTVNTTTRIATLAVSGGGGGVPDTIPAITYSATADLSAERVLSAGNYTVIDLATAAQAQVDWQHGLTCSAGQALTSSGTTAMACTSTITASDLVCAGTCVTSAEIVSVTGAQVSSAVATATALAADPAACGTGEYASDIAANGTLTCSAPAAYAIVAEEATSLTSRGTLNFIGSSVTCVDNPGAVPPRTDCTITGATSPLTTKGDLYTFTTVDARLPTSTDGLCLKTNAATGTGLEWGACSAGGGLSYAETAWANLGGF